MKKLILLASFFLTGFSALQAQIVCVGVSPVGIARNFNFTWAGPANSWGCPDFAIPNTNITDTLMMVDDGTPGTNTQYGNKLSEEGCKASTANKYAGKIVVIRRNTCEFGVKAKFAQDAGAVGVIIVNRDEEVIGMAAGAQGGNVTIPTIMLGKSDGNALIAAMQAGPVVVFIGNKVGLNDNDLTLFPELSLRPKYGTFHKLLASNASDMDLNFGTWIYNYGKNDQTGVTLDVSINKGTTEVYKSSSSKLNVSAGDSVYVDFNNIVLSSYTSGNYSFKYNLYSDSTDEETGDNLYEGMFSISDSILSLANLTTDNKLDIKAHYSPAVAQDAVPYTEWRSCMTFNHPNADKLVLNGVYFSTMADSTNLADSEVSINVYEWSDEMLTADAANQQFNLLPVKTESFFYSENNQNVVEYLEFGAPLKLKREQLYVVCLTGYSPKFRFPYTTINYDANITKYNEWKSPVFIGPEASPTTRAANGFGEASAIGLNVSDKGNIGLNENAIQSVVYPNPTRGNLNIIINKNGAVKMTITDLSGRLVKVANATVENRKLVTDASDLGQGTYIFNLEYQDGTNSTFKVSVN